MTPLYFEDLQVGQRIETAPVTMERDRIVAFATEFDPQPQHLDEETARTSQFGTLVASGWHTAAVTMRLQIDAMFARIPGGGMGAQVDTLAWRRPVLPGDSIHAVVEVLALRRSHSKPGKGIASLRTQTLNQHGQVVMEMDAAVLFPCRNITDL